jgi:hypothetical protein
VPGVAELTPAQIHDALGALGMAGGADAGKAARVRKLAEALRSYGTVRTLLDRAPAAARDAFLGLVEHGPAPVETVLGRGWWGRGMLPPPLDWLQGRGLVVVTDDGMLHAVDEAREGFLELTLEVNDGAAAAAGGDEQMVTVEAAATVVVAPTAAVLNRVLGVPAAGLRAVAATVAVSTRRAVDVAAALRAAGVRLDADAIVDASASEPALPGTIEEAARPGAIRALLVRAVGESRQVRLEYYTSSRAGAHTDRVVDPWDFSDDLLRGYCHMRQGERSFAVDRIGRARLLPTPVDHPRDGG